MSELRHDEKDRDLQRKATEVAVRLAVVGLLAYWCFRIFRPFLMPLIWGVVLAVALAPLYLRLEALLRGRRKLAATLLVVLGATWVTPSWDLSENRMNSFARGDELALRAIRGRSAFVAVSQLLSAAAPSQRRGRLIRLIGLRFGVVAGRGGRND